MNKLLLKACRRCKGDLTLDGDDWICLQCGSYHYVGLYPPQDTASLAKFSHIPETGRGLDVTKDAARGIRAFNSRCASPGAGGQVSPVSMWGVAIQR